MTKKQTDKFGMFLKCHLFLQSNAAELAANAAFASGQAILDSNNTNIVDKDSTATRKLQGFTATKKEQRKATETIILAVAAACYGYYTTHFDAVKQTLAKLNKSELALARDADVLVYADSTIKMATPIVASLLPWGIGNSNLTDLINSTAAFATWLKKPKEEKINSKVAAKEVVDLFVANNTLLEDLDKQMAVYEFTNEKLYISWKLSRAIDDSN